MRDVEIHFTDQYGDVMLTVEATLPDTDNINSLAREIDLIARNEEVYNKTYGYKCAKIIWLGKGQKKPSLIWQDFVVNVSKRRDHMWRETHLPRTIA